MFTGMPPRAFTTLASVGVPTRSFRPARSSSTRTGFLARWTCPGGITQIQSTFTLRELSLKVLVEERPGRLTAALGGLEEQR